mmetsp:Transcript_12351/g.18561  ORF Transcript_12351/g.18561 Transcript_12351/m.18561 type:complete len:132 (+) Transcript_12351:1685-2080(+)
MSITCRSFYLKNPLFNSKQRDVKSSPAKIKDQDIFLCTFLVQPVGNSRSSRLVDYAHGIQSSYNCCILGSLALGIVEVSWYCHNGILHRFPEIRFSNFFHFSKHHRTDFLCLETFRLTLKRYLHYWSTTRA